MEARREVRRCAASAPPHSSPRLVMAVASPRRSYTDKFSKVRIRSVCDIWVPTSDMSRNRDARTARSGPLPRVSTDSSCALPMGPREISASTTITSITPRHKNSNDMKPSDTPTNTSLVAPDAAGTNALAVAMTKTSSKVMVPSTRFTAGVFHGQTASWIARDTARTTVSDNNCARALSVKATAGNDNSGPRRTTTMPYHHTSTRKRNNRNRQDCRNCMSPFEALVGATVTSQVSSARKMHPMQISSTPTITIPEWPSVPQTTALYWSTLLCPIGC
mmetsp:Transcript_64956/g.174187  ORF Transcript_64956/g.174187 Transcript_64956/m.174187 type:complete len:276 (-) Transcript_64956:183-1010(-)